MKKQRIIVYFAIAIFSLMSCDSADQLKDIKAIKLSKKVDSILISEARKSHKVDSLRKQVLSSECDTIKLNILVHVGRNLGETNSQIVFSEVISQASAIGYSEGIYAAALSKEFQFANKLQFDSAKYYYNFIRVLAEKERRMDILASDLINYSMAFERKENLRSADSLLLNALGIMKKYKVQSKYLKAYALFHLGQNKNVEFDNAGALSYLNEAAYYALSSKNYDLAGDIYFRMGECYIMESDYNNALKAYGKSVDYCRKVEDEMVVASDLGAIGEIYMQKEDYKKAYKNLFESLYLSRKINYTYQEAYTSAILGALYQLDSNFVEALRYLNASNKIYESFYADQHQGEILLNKLNIGSVYVSMNRCDEGMRYLTEVYNKINKSEEPAVTSEALNSMGDAKLRMGDLQAAENFAAKALVIAKKIESMVTVKDSYELLYKVYEKKKLYEQAHYYYKVYTDLSDSLSNKTQIKKFAEMEYLINESQLRAQHDKAETTLRKEKTQKETELNRQRITSIIIGIGFVLMLVFAFFIYKSLKENKKKTKIIEEQKKEVEIQKSIIEDQKKEVLDSIVYAKRIQEAILPSDESVRKLFQESFVYYRPKDIVAGDFYWLVESAEYILVAVADCTGHGVPGAMVSVVCSNALNRAAKELALTEPGLILDSVREMVIETFEKGDNEVKDGMDISLLAIPKVKNNLTVNIKWAGANNPLWYISENELFEIKGNKQPVGKFIKQDKFVTVTKELKKGDEIFLISDGFADQFGGPKGKKFKYQQLKDLLIANAQLPMHKQKEILDSAFELWKGNLHQVDDVTILGIKI